MSHELLEGRHQVPGGKGIESRCVSQLLAVSWGRISGSLFLSNDLCYFNMVLPQEPQRLHVLSSSHARQRGLGPHTRERKLLFTYYTGMKHQVSGKY